MDRKLASIPTSTYIYHLYPYTPPPTVRGPTIEGMVGLQQETGYSRVGMV